MPAGVKRKGPMTLLLAAVARLRAAGGKFWADVLVVAAAAAAATAAAIWLGTTTPVRFVENLTSDLRISMAAPRAEPKFVIIKIDDDALNAMSEASPCHCLSP